MAHGDLEGSKHRSGWIGLCSVLAFRLPTALAMAVDAPMDVGAALTHYRCYICYSDREALEGPAFADIAAALSRQPGRRVLHRPRHHDSAKRQYVAHAAPPGIVAAGSARDGAIE